MASAFAPFRGLLLAAVLLSSAAAGRAMSVIAPSFDELVDSAELVVRGVVTDVHCVPVDTPQGQAIRTLVTLHVERVLKGDARGEVTLSFLGGKFGRRSLTVIGMPKFSVGDREIVFVANNGRTICPLIAGGHGRYRVRRDARTDREFIARDNNVPLASTEQIAESLEHSETQSAATPGEALTPEVFEQRVVTKAVITPNA